MNKKKEISKKNSKKVQKQIEERYPELKEVINQQGISFEIIFDEMQLFASKKEYLLFQYEDKLIPTLQLLRKVDVNTIKNFAKAQVDEGALKFLLNGADIFRPGITKFDEFRKGDIVIILNHLGQILCVGQALVDSINIDDEKKTFKNIHFLTDEIFTNKFLI